jgi:hypothetical protein
MNVLRFLILLFAIQTALYSTFFLYLFGEFIVLILCIFGVLHVPLIDLIPVAIKTAIGNYLFWTTFPYVWFLVITLVVYVIYLIIIIFIPIRKMLLSIEPLYSYIDLKIFYLLDRLFGTIFNNNEEKLSKIGITTELFIKFNLDTIENYVKIFNPNFVLKNFIYEFQDRSNIPNKELYNSISDEKNSYENSINNDTKNLIQIEKNRCIDASEEIITPDMNILEKLNANLKNYKNNIKCELNSKLTEIKTFNKVENY